MTFVHFESDKAFCILFDTQKASKWSHDRLFAENLLHTFLNQVKGLLV